MRFTLFWSPFVLEPLRKMLEEHIILCGAWSIEKGLIFLDIIQISELFFNFPFSFLRFRPLIHFNNFGLDFHLLFWQLGNKV